MNRFIKLSFASQETKIISVCIPFDYLLMPKQKEITRVRISMKKSKKLLFRQVWRNQLICNVTVVCFTSFFDALTCDTRHCYCSALLKQLSRVSDVVRTIMLSFVAVWFDLCLYVVIRNSRCPFWLTFDLGLCCAHASDGCTVSNTEPRVMAKISLLSNSVLRVIL